MTDNNSIQKTFGKLSVRRTEYPIILNGLITTSRGTKHMKNRVLYM